uniref:Uncharacterized protein n=1 Tax=Eutreptiella gymnastica TaxID=73025 RepID=A0A7S4CNS4_9EUGL
MSPGRALHVCSASLISSPDLLAPSSSPQPPSARGPPSARDATPCPPPPLPDHGPAASGARGDDSVDSECALYSTSTARPSPSPRGSGGASPAGSIDASTLSCTPRVIPEPRPRSSIGGQDEDSDGGIPPRTAVSTWKGLQLRKRRR